MDNIIFKIISYNTPEYKASISLREEIILKPLGLVFLPEELEKERSHTYFAGFKNDEVVATSLLAHEGENCKMQRVVVKTNLQYCGIGSNMMLFFEKYAKVQGFKSIYCYARDSAVGFYLKHNYIPEGEYFDIDTIQHIQMRKILK